MLIDIHRAGRRVGRLGLLVTALSCMSVPAAANPSSMSLPGPSDEGSPALTGDALRQAGEQALARAVAERQAAYALQGEPRGAALLAAAQAFGSVADDAGLGPAVRAEGAFRAGEILRARKHAQEAGTRFGQAVALGLAVKADEPGGEARVFAARAQLELAHAQRREASLEDALAAYSRVDQLFPAQARQRGQAAGWRARLLAKDGKLVQARDEADLLADLVGLDPIEAVHCADTIASALARSGADGQDLAHAVLSDLDQLIEPHLSGNSRQATKLEEARAAMRVTLSLMGS